MHMQFIQVLLHVHLSYLPLFDLANSDRWREQRGWLYCLQIFRHELRTSSVPTIVQKAFPIIMVWMLPTFQFTCFRPYRV